MAQSQAIHTFVLGTKEFDGKTAEFQYDCGLYSIFDLVGEERRLVYKSKNAQEAYMKWNVYIGRKKERPQRQLLLEEGQQNVMTIDRSDKKPDSARKAPDTETRAAVSGTENKGNSSHEQNRGRSDKGHNTPQRPRNDRNHPDRYSNRSNRTRRESVKNVSGDDLAKMEDTATERSGNNYRRDHNRRRKHYSRENGNE